MQDLLSGYELVAGTFLPLLIAVFIREEWKKELKIIVSFLFVLAASVGHLFYSGEWGLQNLSTSVLAILVLTITTYKGFWLGTGITGYIEKHVLAGKASNLLIAFLFMLMLWIPVVAGFTAIQGCTATVGVMNPKFDAKRTYLASRLEFNAVWKQYLDYYDRAPKEHQAKWKAEIDPWFNKGKTALDAWGLAVNQGADPAAKMQTFINIKNELIDMLVPIMGHE
jgi:hypothetical protein